MKYVIFDATDKDFIKYNYHWCVDKECEYDYTDYKPLVTDCVANVLLFDSEYDAQTFIDEHEWTDICKIAPYADDSIVLTADDLYTLGDDLNAESAIEAADASGAEIATMEIADYECDLDYWLRITQYAIDKLLIGG